MKRKISQNLDRRELAKELEEIAAYFRKGTFELEGASWQVPDALDQTETQGEEGAHLNPP